jgi:hypothetical protein
MRLKPTRAELGVPRSMTNYLLQLNKDRCSAKIKPGRSDMRTRRKEIQRDEYVRHHCTWQ